MHARMHARKYEVTSEHVSERSEDAAMQMHTGTRFDLSI